VPHNTTIALVTGANKGIGRAIAQRLAETGMTVLIAARAARRGGAAVAALRAVGAHPVVLDVTAPATLEAAAAQVADRFGRHDGGAHLCEGGTSQVPSPCWDPALTATASSRSATRGHMTWPRRHDDQRTAGRRVHYPCQP
jgi:NAD(P)-dependent dehydrogenase (short-subunit alcohol dehydrogenase family)